MSASGCRSRGHGVRTALPVGLVLLLALALATGRAAAQPLIADLSKNLIAITTGFAGADVLLFGAVEEGGEVVVVVRGPEQGAVVRRKDRILGVWVNRQSMHFDRVPAFYAVAASRPLADLAPPAVLTRYRIGLDHLRFPTSSRAPFREIEEFRKALIRNKQGENLYKGEVAEVTFLGKRLFRTNVHFPANVVTGSYTAEVYLVRNGEVVSVQSTPLVVRKVGVEAELYDFAHRQAALYGLVAVAVAIAAGWMAAAVFRRV